MYRMVEDEFLLVAHRFTAHIHRAEYTRMTALAKSQNAAAIREMERPVVGPATKTVQRRWEASRRSFKQRQLVEEQDDDDEEGVIAGMSGAGAGLRGLMESPRKEARTIRSFNYGTSDADAAPRTKAAAAAAAAAARTGLGSPSRSSGPYPGIDTVSDLRPNVSRLRDEMTAEGHLGSQPSDGSSSARRTTKPPGETRVRPGSRPVPGSPSTAQATESRKSMSSRPRSLPNLKRPPQSGQTIRLSSDNDDDEEDSDDPFGIKKRRIRRQKSREQLRRPVEHDQRQGTPDTIPTFL